MQAHAQQCPAIGEDEANAFVIRVSSLDTLFSSAHLKGFENMLAIGFKILILDFQTVFTCLCRFAKVFDKLGEPLALFLLLPCGNEELNREVGAIIQEIVLTECAVAARLNGKRRLRPRSIQTNALIDDILVAAFEAKVLQSKLSLKEDGEFVTRDRIRDNGAAVVFRR